MPTRLNNLSLARPLCLIVMLAMLVIFLMCFGDVGSFIDIPSFIFVSGLTLFSLLFSFGTNFLRFIPAAFLSLFQKDATPCEVNVDICRYGCRYAIGFGALGTIIGLVQMLYELEDPAQVGLGMAVSLLTLIYGVIISECLFAPLRTRFLPKDAMNMAEKDSFLDWQSASLCLGILTIILAFFVLMNTFVSETSQSQSGEGEVLNQGGNEISFPEIRGSLLTTSDRRYFFVEVSMTVTSPELAKYFELESTSNPLGMCKRMKADIVAILSSLDADALSSQNRAEIVGTKIKDRLNQRLREAGAPGEVKEVYFPVFLIQ